jgi:hypothetical protein
MFLKLVVGIAIVCLGVLVLFVAGYFISGEVGSSFAAGAPALCVALVLLGVGIAVIVSGVRDRRR